MIRWYDRDGQPMPEQDAAALLRDEAYRRVGRDEGDGWMVSTVWIGLDHNYGDEPPLIFETMVFDGPLDGETVRYSTWTEAQAGHVDMVEQVRST